MREVSFSVKGTPVPQGSMRAFVVKGRAVLTSTSGNKLKVWRNAIRETARPLFPSPHLGPVHLSVVFLMPRPKTLPKKILHHIKRPDSDKLLRAVGDALTSVAYKDDSQINEIYVFKVYAPESIEPGVEIKVTLLEESE